LRSTLEHIEQITGPGGSLQASLADLRAVTGRLAGKGGVLAATLGGEEEAKKVIAAIERTNALLAKLGGVSDRLDGILAKTDQRVFSSGGVMDETQRAVAQANAMLGEVRESLKKVDQVLKDAQDVSGNAKAATQDLGALRAEVDASLRKVSGMIDEINRKWPFKRDAEIKLP
jgi:phospholipid/cholesterol/gamma-HCH transport system substrate-binding protein